METIFDCPGYRIYRPYEGRKFRHGDKIAIPFQSSRYGTLYHFFTLGTVAGYAIERGEDPFPEVERAQANGHKLYWANANSVIISNPPQAKTETPGFNWGDELILQGHRFRLAPAPNNNCELIPLD